MSRFHLYIQIAATLLRSYSGSEPFAIFLKAFFSKQKKYGSRDRKAISSICYSYFRAGHALGKEPTPENLSSALFLCAVDASGVLQELAPHLSSKLGLPALERLSVLGLKIQDIIPFASHLSPAIDMGAYALSLLEQPALFVRIRPGRHAEVIQKLHESGISFEKVGKDCIKLPNQTKLEGLVKVNQDVVVQDRSSQQVLEILISEQAGLRNPENRMKAWDCCAASGGKSILLYDLSGGTADITITDIRKNILANGIQRLKEAGVPIAGSFVADLTKPAAVSKDLVWPLVICDVPCTGSGTWSRTPEQAFFFDPAKVSEYAQRQRRMLANILPHVSKNGLLLYITCSVFEEENEGVMRFAAEQLGISQLDMRYISGYNQQADSMFVAVCRVP